MSEIEHSSSECIEGAEAGSLAPGQEWSIEAWRNAGRFFDYCGHQIFYRDTGEVHKPTLVFLHGFPTSSWDWKDVWNDLEQSFRLVCFDFLGFGLSDKPTDLHYSIILQADLCQALLSSLGIGRYHILAHDYGDTVAQELLARDNLARAQMIESCIFLNGGLFPETHKPVFMQKLLLSPLGGLVARLASYKRFRSNFDRICAVSLGEDVLQVHWRLLEQNNGRVVLPKLIHYMRERVRHRERWVAAMTEYERPLRLIDGLDDPISGAHMLGRFKEVVLNAESVGIAGVGHYPHNEAPKEVLKAAHEFWDAQGFARAS